MWQLHRQGAGGIIGDEMGLGKTVQVCGGDSFLYDGDPGIHVHETHYKYTSLWL